MPGALECTHNCEFCRTETQSEGSSFGRMCNYSPANADVAGEHPLQYFSEYDFYLFFFKVGQIVKNVVSVMF